MTRINKTIVAVIILLILIISTGCSFIGNPMKLVEEDSVRADIEDIINAVESKDTDHIYNTYFEKNIISFDEDDIEEGMNEIYDIYKGEKISAELYNVNVRSFNGSATKDVVYLVRTTKSTFNMNLTYKKDSNSKYRIVGIHVSEFLDYVVNSKLSDYTTKNWILLFLNIISYGIIILALILCIKTKIKLKPLWIILILLQLGVTITAFPANFNFHVSVIKLFGMSKYLLYAHGGTITSVFIPIFAIVFLFIRKSLNNSYLRQQELYKARAESQQRYREEQATKAIQKINNVNNGQNIKIESDKNIMDK